MTAATWSPSTTPGARDHRLISLDRFTPWPRALSADGKQLALGWTNINRDTHTLALFDPATGALSSTLPAPAARRNLWLWPSVLTAGTWSQERAGGSLELWDVPAHRHLAAWQLNAGPSRVSFNPDGGQILSIADGRCCLWEVPTGQQREFRRGAEDRAAAAAYSPDGKWIATGGKAGVLRILSAATGEVVAEFHGHNDAILTVAYSPDGKWIATGGKDRVLRIFSAATGEVVAEFHGHNDAIGQVAYSPDGQSIWTVSGDGTARCWDAAAQGDPRVLRHMSYVYSVAYSPDGRWFASAGWHDPSGGASDIYPVGRRQQSAHCCAARPHFLDRRAGDHTRRQANRLGRSRRVRACLGYRNRPWPKASFHSALQTPRTATASA